jgi:hypothetical protein
MERPRGAERGVTLRAVLEPRAGGRFCGRGAFQSAMKGDNMPPSAPTRGGCAAARVEGRRSKVEGWENTWRLRGGQKEASRKGQPGESPPKATLRRRQNAECRMQNRRAKPPKATHKPPTSHPQATNKPPTSHQQATNKPPTSHQQATNKPLASHLQARCMGGASVLPSYSLRIPFVFSSYSLGILLLFSGGAFRGAMAAPPSPCLSSTRLVCPLFKRNRIFLSGNSSRQP